MTGGRTGCRVLSAVAQRGAVVVECPTIQLVLPKPGPLWMLPSDVSGFDWLMPDLGKRGQVFLWPVTGTGTCPRGTAELQGLRGRPKTAEALTQEYHT